MRKLLIGCAALALAAQAGIANAAVVATSTPYGFGVPTGTGPLLTFDGVTPLSGFTLTGTGYDIRTGTSTSGAAPAISPTLDDTTNYLNVFGGAATLSSGNFYNVLSLYWGSIDTYNTIELLSGNTVVGTITSTTPGVGGGSGDQDSGLTNRSVVITSTTAFNGVRFSSATASFEVDNVQFSAAVPEPATWAMMIGGFGFVGGALRRRRITTRAAIA